MNHILFAYIPGLPEILIVLVIVLLLFGKRVPGAMRSLGSSIVEFKKGMNEDEKEKLTDSEEEK